MAIVGDSMVKNIYGPTYSDNKINVFLKSISGVKQLILRHQSKLNIPVISHGNIDTRTHINYRSLHLTRRGSNVLGDNIVKLTKLTTYKTYKTYILFTKLRFDYMDISHSNINRNCKPNIKNDSVKELTQFAVANDDTVNFLHQKRLKIC